MKPSSDGTFRRLIIIVLLLMFAADAAKSLTCDVTRLPDGSIHYELSHPPSSPQCQTGWENLDKTVIARDPDFDPKLVENMTNRSVTLKLCQEYLHYTKDCASGWEEAHCKINCSLFEEVKVLHTTTVNTTLICVSKSWCLTQMQFGFSIAGILLLGVAVLGGLYCWKSRKCRRGGSATTRASYTPANEQIKMEMGEMEEMKTRQPLV